MSEGCVQTGFSSDDENSCFNNPATLNAFDNINIGDKICSTLSADTRFDIDSFVFTTVGGRDLEVTLNVLDNSFDIQVDFDKVDDADRCTSTLTFDRRTSSGGSLVFQPEKVIIGAPNEPLDAGTYRITVAPVNGDSLDLPCSSGSSSGPLGYELLVTDVTTTTTTTTDATTTAEATTTVVSMQMFNGSVHMMCPFWFKGISLKYLSLSLLIEYNRGHNIIYKYSSHNHKFSSIMCRCSTN